MKIQNSQSGQTLIELLAALAIGILLITGFVSLGVTALRNSTSSSDQVTATKYAQEGIEAMITIRDQNSPCNGATCAIQNFSVSQWQDLFTTSMTCTSPSDLTTSCANDFVLLTSTCSLGNPLTAQRCIQRNASSYNTSSWQIGSTKFYRKIRITDALGVTNVKDVTVFVWWTDAIGLHKSVLSRKLSKDKL